MTTNIFEFRKFAGDFVIWSLIHYFIIIPKHLQES